MHIPVNKPVLIYLSSKDVIHCFSLPIMRIKQDVIPGMRMPTWFTPVKTGQSEIACAQLCGLGHYRMKGYLTVDTEEEFNAWLAKQSTAQTPETGGADEFWN
jgi:cytochrome c oxidase subunit 2